jgi:LDH2 family malate/lactate/ureidoglycolate dehydrogenase
MLEVLVKDAGLSLQSAEAVVEHLTFAEQYGKPDQGLIRVKWLLEKGFYFDSAKAPDVTYQRPAVLRTDGHKNVGYFTMQCMVRAAIDIAQKQGICVALGRRCYPSGMLGYYAQLAAKAGLAMVMVANSPARVAPSGRFKPVVGTNPLCVSLPTIPFPLVADFATSAITHGKLLIARFTGASLPPDTVEIDGDHTVLANEIDPSAEKGVILPFGGLSGYKAFGLALAIESFCSLTGGSPGSMTGTDFGVFSILFNPSQFGYDLNRVSLWLQQLETSGVRIPGWESTRRAQRLHAQGIVEVNRDIWAQVVQKLRPYMDPDLVNGVS